MVQTGYFRRAHKTGSFGLLHLFYLKTKPDCFIMFRSFKKEVGRGTDDIKYPKQ
jgi:hypothetical protein